MLLPLFNLLLKVFVTSAQSTGESGNFVVVKEEVFYEKHGDQCTDFDYFEIIPKDKWKKRPNYIHAVAAKSKSAHGTKKKSSQYCQTFKNCRDCTLHSTFQCVWCHEFGCDFNKNKECESHVVKFCPVIKHKGIVLIPAGPYTEISLNLLISNPKVIAHKHLYCKIVMPHNKIILPASYRNGKITCERHVFDDKVGCGYIRVFWGGFQPYSNKLDVFKYRCNNMAQDPTSCSTISERYDCQWCLSSGLCTLRVECNNVPYGALQLKTTTPKEENEFPGDTKQTDQYTDLHYDTNHIDIKPNFTNERKFISSPTSLSPPPRTTHITRIPEILLQQLPAQIDYDDLAKPLHTRLTPIKPEEATDEKTISPTERALTDAWPFLKPEVLKVTNQNTATQLINNQLRNISPCINDIISVVLFQKNKEARLIKLLRNVKRLLGVVLNMDLNACPSITFNLRDNIMGKMKDIDVILLESKLEERAAEGKEEF